MINKLPMWVFSPASRYDTESVTEIEAIARLQGKMNELVEDYNKFVDEANSRIENFVASTDEEQKVFETALRQEFQDFIDTINLEFESIEKVIADQFTDTNSLINDGLREIDEAKKVMLSEIEITAQIVQGPGDSETAVMSQKATTIEFDKVYNLIDENLLKIHKSKNLFNPTISFVDGVIYTTGELLIAGYEGNVTSDYISVKPSRSLVFTRLATASERIGMYLTSVGYYDINKNFIRADYGPSQYVFNTPENCYYIRFSSRRTYVTNNDYRCMIEYGESVITDVTHYEPYFEPYFEVIAYPKTTEEIVCWGDSLTYGTGATSGYTYPEVLSQLTGKVVHSCGFPGDTSAEICGYQGANPLMVQPCTIPASGSVTIEIYDYLHSDDTPFRFPTIANAIGANSVSIGGVEGTLDLSSGGNLDSRSFVFTRATPGEEVVLTYETPLIFNLAKDRQKDIQIIFIGTNGGFYGEPSVLISQIDSMIHFNPAFEKKFIIVGIPTGTASYRAELETAMKTHFARHYINLRDYLVKAGLTDAGITPTESDLNDIKNGTVPTSLRVDETHFNNAGYTILARQIYKKGKELGYW